MFFKKKINKKQHESNSPLEKDDYKGNLIEDDSNFQERTKQSIESKDQELEEISEKKLNNILEEEEANIEFNDLSDEVDNLDVGSPLKNILKKIKNAIKKRKNKKFASNINNDRAPSLGNEVVSDSSLSKEEVKKRKSILNTISKILTKNRVLESQINAESNILKDVSIKDPNQAEMGMDKAEKIRQEHTQQLADAINDIGESSKKGRWADALSDSYIKEKQNKGIGR